MSYLKSDPQFYLIAEFCEKPKMPTFGNKNALFGCFWARILKNYCHILNQHSQNLSNSKISGKIQKWLNLGIKMPDLDSLGIEL